MDILIGLSMKNKTLVQDYLIRCHSRMAAIDVLYKHQNWADVVRESQETVELALKALLKHCNIEVPKIHDVGDILLENETRLPEELKKDCQKFSEISRDLRRDRELSFYGSEDLTPSEFYKEKDAKKAKEEAQWLVTTISKALKIAF